MADARPSTDLPPDPVAQDAAPDEAAASSYRRQWLLMVYMAAAAPNLQEPLGLDLEELMRPLRDMGVKSSLVTVVVQVDTPTGVSKRFRLRRHRAVRLMVKPTKVDTTLLNFVEGSIKKYRPRYSALVIWGHASGIGRGFDPAAPFIRKGDPGQQGEEPLVDDMVARTPCPDDVRKRSKDVKKRTVASAGTVWGQLGQLPADCVLDIVGFDACFMASVEVVSELRGSLGRTSPVHYMLAPQGDIGLEGWHYDLMLDQIVAGRARLTPVKLGMAVVEQVGLSRSSPETLSLIEVRRVDELLDALCLLIKALDHFYRGAYREPGFRRLLEDAVHAALWARVRQFLDLADLCRVLASRVPDCRIRTAARDVLAILDRADRPFIVDHVCALDLPLGGLSIYSPWPRATSVEFADGVRNIQVDECEYEELLFAKKTLWTKLMYYPDAIASTERRWVRREVRDKVDETRDWLDWSGRTGDPKAPGRAGDPKAPGRAGDPKAPGRGGGGRFRNEKDDGPLLGSEDHS